MKVQAVDPLCETVIEEATTSEFHKEAKVGHLKPESRVEAHLLQSIKDLSRGAWLVIANNRIDPNDDQVRFRQRWQNDS